MPTKCPCENSALGGKFGEEERGGLKGGVPVYHYVICGSRITAAFVYTDAKNKISRCHIQLDIKPETAISLGYQDRTLRSAKKTVLRKRSGKERAFSISVFTIHGLVRETRS